MGGRWASKRAEVVLAFFTIVNIYNETIVMMRTQETRRWWMKERCLEVYGWCTTLSSDVEQIENSPCLLRINQEIMISVGALCAQPAARKTQNADRWIRYLRAVSKEKSSLATVSTIPTFPTAFARLAAMASTKLLKETQSGRRFVNDGKALRMTVFGRHHVHHPVRVLSTQRFVSGKLKRFALSLINLLVQCV